MNKRIDITCASMNGRKITAPLEVWMLAILSTMDARSREAVFNKVEQMSVKTALQTGRVLTSLNMPHPHG